MRGLKRTRTQTQTAAPSVDPLETVPLYTISVIKPTLDNVKVWSHFEQSDPFGDSTAIERMLAGGYNPEWLKETVWQSAFCTGLLRASLAQ